MGRYILFNTGHEYKFLFGIQQDTDIEYYGGQWMLNEETGAIHMVWGDADISLVNQRLMEMEYAYLFDRPDFAAYEQNSEGTLNLKYDFWKKYDYYKIDDLKSRYLLGLLIYHQLSYKCPLSALTDG